MKIRGIIKLKSITKNLAQKYFKGQTIINTVKIIAFIRELNNI